MKMKKLSKILILVLSVALICTGLVFAVSAEDEAPTFDLKTAISNASAGSTIVMTGNADLSKAAGVDGNYGISINKNLTIDLNGYTINAPDTHRVFNMNTANVRFIITGSGTINVGGALIYMGQDKDGTSGGIIGTGNGITINHTGTGTNSSGSVQKMFFGANRGEYTFKNMTLNTTSTGDYLFKNNSSAINTSMNFVDVEINATEKSAGAKVAVFCPNLKGSISLNYCRISTMGHSLFGVPNTQTEKVENYLVVNNSYIKLSYGSGSGPTLLYIASNGYGDLASDVVFNNSYVSFNSQVLAKHNHNGSAIIFRNTGVHYNGKQGNLFRSMNVRLEEGSYITGNHTYYASDTTIYSANDNSGAVTLGDNSKVQMILFEGARFDAATYNKLVNHTGTKKDDGTAVTYYPMGSIAYPDGSLPTSSTTYKMVYDPIGNGELPYVVVTADKAATVVDPLYFSGNPTTANVYNPTGTVGNINFEGKYFYRFISNGSLNSNNSAPCYIWGLKNGSGVAAADHGVFVFDFDLATDSGVGFTEALVNIHARANANGDTNKATVGSLFKITEDGTVLKTTWNYEQAANKGYDVESDSGIKLSLNDWNHVTIVVDTTEALGTAHVYINGTYVNSHVAYDTDAYLFGPRINTTGAGAKNKDSSFIVDNVMIRTADPTEAMTDNGASYLLNGGKAWNDFVYNDAITLGGIAVKDVNTAIALQNELGVVAKISKNIIASQTVTNEGTVLTGGKTIAVAEGSVAYVVVPGADGSEYGTYVFDDKYGALTAKYQFYTSYKTDDASLADPNNWTAVGETDLSTPLASLYNGAALSTNGKYSDKGYLTATHIGWTDTLGSTNLREGTATEEEAQSGEVIKLYPVLSTYTKSYDIVILNANGQFDRGYNGTVWYGSGLRKFELKYGETLVLNANVTSQVAISQVFGTSADPGNAGCTKTKAGATAERYNGFDFNGFTWKIDTNYNQNKATGKVFALNVYEGETLDVYSSYPGGALVMYGNATNAAGEVSASGGVAFSFYGCKDADSIADSANGEVTQNNTTLNVGTVDLNGKTIPGSNLSISTAVILDTFSGDNTCKINIDGITATKNSSDYSGMFISRQYFGAINVTNSTIINPVTDNVFHGHEQGYVAATETAPAERALAEVTVDNCLILVANNGDGFLGDVINKDYSFKTIKFTNCVTNGKLIKDEFGALVLGAGNKAVQMSSDAIAENVTRAKLNHSMEFATQTVSVPYFTLVDDNFADSNPDYNYLNYTFSLTEYDGEAGVTLPILVYTTVPTEEVVDVTYTDLATGNVVTDKYAKGGNVVIEATNYNGNAVIANHKGTWTIGEAVGSALPTNVQESVTLIPEYDVTANISGLKANLSLYSDFLVNLYIPAELAQYVTAVNGKALASDTVSFGEAQFVKAIVAKNAKEATDDATFEIAIKEGEYTAAKTVKISIADYAAAILAGDQYADTDKALMYYMLNYAAEAAKYLEGAEDAEIAKLLADNAEWNVITVEKTFANAIANTGLDSIFASAGITLNAAPAFTFTSNGKFTGTVTVTYGDGNVRTFTVPADSTAKLIVEDMKIYNFATTLTVTATGTVVGMEGEQTIVGTINLDTYAKYHTENAANAESETKAESADALALINALYDYVKVAEQYKAGTLTLPGAEGEVTPEPAPAE